MTEQVKTIISIQVSVLAPPDKAWKHFTSPGSICAWNQASDDWHTTHATNDVRTGGRFLSRMEAKDGSFGFDFEGIYERVEEGKLLEYLLDDGRRVSVRFTPLESGTLVEESFEAEGMNSVEMQRQGWQSILNSFKAYTEAN